VRIGLLRTHTRICTIRQGCKFSRFVYDLSVSEIPEKLPLESGNASGKRWESLIWPRWLPTRARLPLIAQISGAALLLAAVAMPNWSSVAPESDPTVVPVANAPAAPITPAFNGATGPISTPPPPVPSRPAHLNLDVRHNFRSVDLSVTVDGRRELDTKIQGSAKKFGVFGKRGEKGFTATLDLEPGARVVRVRVRSTADKFDQTRVERFDLGSASVASLRIVAEKSGLSVFADRPPAPAPQVAGLVPPTSPGAPVAHAAPHAMQQQLSAAAELYQVLRQSLIAIAGFVASAATGYLVQEFLRSRKGFLGL